MIVGFDFSNRKRTTCIAKTVPETGADCAILLSADGTSVAPDAVLDGIEPVLKNTAALLTQEVEKAACGSGADDMVYISTYLTTICNRANSIILDTSDFLGQGIYISGVIMYHIAGRYLFLLFGGTAIYSVRGTTLQREGTATDDPFVRNALGSTQNWHCELIQGISEPGVHFFLTSRPLTDLNAACHVIATGQEGAHPNTMPMLLVRELTKGISHPAAVMEIRFQEE